MADALVPPGNLPANILCRQWNIALDAYQAAALRAEHFYETRIRSHGAGLTPELAELEDRSDELLAEKHDRMCDLIAAPAPSLAAFAIKVELVCREYLAWDPTERDIADALTADARRLIRR